MTHPDPRIAELTSLLGPSGVVADDDTASYLIDERKVFVGSAIAVVRPASTAEVAAVMSWCSANKIAVVSQGGNSGLSGGATPERNGDSIVLSLRRMNTIESVDVARSTMTVQAGVIVEAAQQAAA